MRTRKADICALSFLLLCLTRNDVKVQLSRTKVARYLDGRLLQSVETPLCCEQNEQAQR